MFVQKHTISNTWCGILDNAKFVQKGVRREVGNGRTTLFWHHSWATHKPLLLLAQQPIHTCVINNIVEDYWDPMRGWKWEEFSDIFPNEILRKIAAFEVSPGIENEDQFIWNGPLIGKFTIKSAMNFIQSTNQEEEDLV